jgi:hypothetical protein
MFGQQKLERLQNRLSALQSKFANINS